MIIIIMHPYFVKKKVNPLCPQVHCIDLFSISNFYFQLTLDIYIELPTYMHDAYFFSSTVRGYELHLLSQRLLFAFAL